MIKYNDEIFDYMEEDSDKEIAIAIIWWLTHLLGGKVVISQDRDFWDDNLPSDRSLVMYKEDGQVILAAERLDRAED